MSFDSGFWSIVTLTLKVSGLAILFSALLGIPVGIWLGLSRGKLKTILRPFVHTGMALPPVLIGLVLYILLSHSGPLASLGWLFTVQAMILAQTLLALPFIVGITMTAVSAIPEEFTQQIQSLGASPRQIRWTILQEARSGVLLSVAAAFGRSISEVGAVLIVGGNILGETRVLTTAIVLETGQGEFGFALLLGAMLLLLALTVNVAILKLYGGRNIV